jgi:hypothetical protein
MLFLLFLPFPCNGTAGRLSKIVGEFQDAICYNKSNYQRKKTTEYIQKLSISNPLAKLANMRLEICLSQLEERALCTRKISFFFTAMRIKSIKS